jgi:hypothetical protein
MLDALPEDAVADAAGGPLSNLPYDVGRWFAAASPPAAHCGTAMAAQPQQADGPPAQSIVSSVPRADIPRCRSLKCAGDPDHSLNLFTGAAGS